MVGANGSDFARPIVPAVETLIVDAELIPSRAISHTVPNGTVPEFTVSGACPLAPPSDRAFAPAPDTLFQARCQSRKRMRF